MRRKRKRKRERKRKRKRKRKHLAAHTFKYERMRTKWLVLLRMRTIAQTTLRLSLSWRPNQTPARRASYLCEKRKGALSFLLFFFLSSIFRSFSLYLCCSLSLSLSLSLTLSLLLVWSIMRITFVISFNNYRLLTVKLETRVDSDVLTS